MSKKTKNQKPKKKKTQKLQGVCKEEKKIYPFSPDHESPVRTPQPNMNVFMMGKIEQKGTATETEWFEQVGGRIMGEAKKKSIKEADQSQEDMLRAIGGNLFENIAKGQQAEEKAKKKKGNKYVK